MSEVNILLLRYSLKYALVKVFIKQIKGNSLLSLSLVLRLHETRERETIVFTYDINKLFFVILNLDIKV